MKYTRVVRFHNKFIDSKEGGYKYVHEKLISNLDNLIKSKDVKELMSTDEVLKKHFEEDIIREEIDNINKEMIISESLFNLLISSRDTIVNSFNTIQRSLNKDIVFLIATDDTYGFLRVEMYLDGFGYAKKTADMDSFIAFDIEDYKGSFSSSEELLSIIALLVLFSLEFEDKS